MPSFSVLTNTSAMNALFKLNQTQKSLDMNQQRINTGFRVGSAKDDAATFVVAQGMRSDVAGFKKVRENMALGLSTLGTATEAAGRVSSELTSIKEKIIQASNQETGRSDIQTAISRSLENIRGFTSTATFNGINLLDGSRAQDGEAFSVVSSMNRNADGALTLGKISVDYQDLSIEDADRGLGVLNSIDVTAGKSTEAVTTRTDPVNAQLTFTGAPVAGEQFAFNYVDDEGNSQSITFDTYVASELTIAAGVTYTTSTGTGTAATATSTLSTAAVTALGVATPVTPTADEISNALTRISFTLDKDGVQYDFDYDATQSGATDAATLKAAIEATTFFTDHGLTFTVTGGVQGTADVVITESGNATSTTGEFSALTVEYSETTRATLSSDTAIVGATTANAAEHLAERLTELSSDGKSLAGLGFSFDGTTVASTMTASRGLSDGSGELAAFTTANDTTKLTTGTFVLNEADGNASQVSLAFNKDLEVGDTIDLTFHNGSTAQTFTLVVGSQGDTAVSGSLIAGSNNKFHLDYEDVIDNAGTAKTTSDVAQVIYNTLTLAGNATDTNAGKLVHAINTHLGATATHTLGGNSEVAFKLSLDANTVSITDTQQLASGGDTYSVSAFNMDNATGGSLDFDFMLDQLNAAEAHLNSVTAQLGAAESALESQDTFMEALVSAVEGGIGTLVDANMAEESAKFQALQVQQQLGLQALSIANQQPQAILSLFR